MYGANSTGESFGVNRRSDGVRHLLLLKGLSYMYHPSEGRVMHFQRDIPKEVSDDVASVLMKTGKFEEVPPASFNDLEGADISVRYTGSIGDAVAISNCLGKMKRDHPDYHIVGLVTGGFRRISQLIGKDVEMRSWFTRGRGRIQHVDLRSAPRIPGEGFKWEDGFASALGLGKEYPKPTLEMKQKLMEHDSPNMLLRLRKKEKMVVLQVWSGHSRSKSYHPGKVGDLMRGLADKGYDCVAIGTGGEPKYKADFIDTRGKCNLIDSAALLARADLAITVDSWGWHMTKLVFVPQVVLWGSLNPQGKAKSWEAARTLRGILCPGKDCDIYSCAKSDCIDSIEVFDILEAVDEVVDEAKSKNLGKGGIEPFVMKQQAIVGV